MDNRGNIYPITEELAKLDEAKVREDEARLDGYLRARAETDAKKATEYEALAAEFDRIGVQKGLCRMAAAGAIGFILERITYESMEVDFEVCGGCGTIIDIDAESCGCECPPRGKTKTFYVISSETLNEISHG